MKQRILSDICLKLSELAIPYTIKDESYINASETFYDIDDSMNLKKVKYDLRILVDEEKQSVYLYVSTIDESLLPDGVDSSRSASMFRKVKRVTYGTDGDASIETVDLGAVPNTAKDTAFKYGWKFSTALNLNKPIRRQPVKSATPPLEPMLTFDDLETPSESENIVSAAIPKKSGGFFRKLFKKGSYQPRH